MSQHATGRAEKRDGTLCIVFERRFRAPIDAVWAAVTEPDRLARWIGRYTGDPTTGTVSFTMSAEGDDVAAEDITITECEPPRHLAVVMPGPEGAPWSLTVDLVEQAGETVLRFAQAMDDPDLASSVGPGWDYYLDRLAAAVSQADVEAISFDDYYPAFAEHYRVAVERGRLA